MPSIPEIIAELLVIFFAIGIHEFAHAKFADNAGDPTPRLHGRVTLNLFKHFDPLGAIFIILTSLTGFGIGWGKPVPMDPSKMKNPRWDHFMAVIAGPFSNLIQALIYAVLLRIGLAVGLPQGSEAFLGSFLIYGVQINLALCFFNLIPIGPLDGMWILGTFLPEKSRFNWTRWNLTAGSLVFLLLIVVGQSSPELRIISRIIGPPTMALFRLLTGVPL